MAFPAGRPIWSALPLGLALTLLAACSLSRSQGLQPSPANLPARASAPVAAAQPPASGGAVWVQATASSKGAHFPALARAESAAVLAWFDDGEGEPGLHVSVVDESLRVSDGYRVAAVRKSSAAPALAWTGSEYLLAWLDEDTPGRVHIARLSPQAQLLERAAQEIGPGLQGATDLAIATAQSESLVLVRGEGPASGLYAGLLRPKSLDISFGPITGASPLAARPAAVGDERGWSLGWVQAPGPDGELWLSRLARAGQIAAPVLVDRGVLGGPAFAAGPDGALVAWESANRGLVRVAWLKGGAAEPGLYKELPRPGRDVKAAWNGDRFVLSWISREYGLAAVAELTLGLELLGEPRLLAFDQGLRAQRPALAAERSPYLLAWEESGWGTHQIVVYGLNRLPDILGTGFVKPEERVGQLFVPLSSFVPHAGQPELEPLRCDGLSLPAAWKLRDGSEDGIAAYVLLPYEPMRRLHSMHLLLTRSSPEEGNVFVRITAGSISEDERKFSPYYEWPHPTYLSGEQCRWRGHTVPVTNFPLSHGDDILWLTIKREGGHRLDNLHAPAYFLGAVVEYALDGP